MSEYEFIKIGRIISWQKVFFSVLTNIGPKQRRRKWNNKQTHCLKVSLFTGKEKLMKLIEEIPQTHFSCFHCIVSRVSIVFDDFFLLISFKSINDYISFNIVFKFFTLQLFLFF